MYIVNNFRNKILCSQRNEHIQILGRIPGKKDFIEEIFGLCAVNVMHVLDPFFFQVKPWCWKTYHISDISGQPGFALEIALKC